MRMRPALAAGTLAGMAALGIAGQAFLGTASADPTPSPVPSDSTEPPTPDSHLDVTLTPDKVAQGGSVKIEAVSGQGIFINAIARCPAFDAVSLVPNGEGAAGTGHVHSDARPGVYPVIVNAMGHDGVKLHGGARLTVVQATISPSPTPTVPKGGVGTGGGGTAVAANVALISAGSAIALLGVTLTVAAIRRSRTDVRA